MNHCSIDALDRQEREREKRAPSKAELSHGHPSKLAQADRQTDERTQSYVEIQTFTQKDKTSKDDTCVYNEAAR